MDNRKPQDGFNDLFSVKDLGQCVKLCSAEIHCRSIFHHARNAKCGIVHTFLPLNTSRKEDGWIYQERHPCCQEGWRGFRNKCYLFVKEELNYYNAKQFCEDKGAYLVEILSFDIDSFIYHTMRKDGLWKAWTGAVRDVDGVFKWVHSGKELGLDWAVYAFVDDGSSMEYIAEPTYGIWNDIHPLFTRSIICETDKS